MEKYVKTKSKLKGKFLEFRTDVVEIENSFFERDVVMHPGAVSLIGIKNNKLMLVEQYRYALDEVILEIPAGKIEKNENIKDAVIRETIEETGYFPKNMEYLGEYIPAPGFCNEKIHLFFSKDLIKYEDMNSKEKKLYQQDLDESINLKFLSKKELNDLFINNKLKDLKTLAAFMYAKEFLDE